MKITISDVAKASGVNISTVSRALNNDSRISDETKGKVHEAVKALGYKPLRKRKIANQEIIVAIPNIKVNMVGELLTYISDALGTSPYDVRVVNLKGQRDITPDVAKELCSKKPVGIILFSCSVGEAGAEIFRRENVATVAMFTQTRDIPVVNANDYKGIMQSTQYAIERGYKNIGYVGFTPNDHHSYARYDGFIAAMRSTDIVAPPVVTATLDQAGGYRATKELMENSEIDCIVYSADIMAYGGLGYFRERGMTYPDDIGIIAFDNTALSEVIGLTTMDEQIKEVADLLITYLFEMIHSGQLSQAKEVLLTPKLVVRDSMR